MTPPGTLRVRPRGPAAVRTRWYRSLAYALAATRESGAVFEATLPDPVPVVTVGPASVIELVGGAPTERRPENGARPEPPIGWTQSMRSLVASRPGSAAGTYRSGLARRPPVEGWAGDPPVWLAIQTHWLRGATGDL